MAGMPRIAMVPVGTPDRHALDDLARDLNGMGFDVERAGRRALPRGAFDAGAASSMPMPCSAWRFQ
jgi:hypothetical protein